MIRFVKERLSADVHGGDMASAPPPPSSPRTAPPCFTSFERVCWEPSGTILYDERSLCDGQRCLPGPFPPASRFPRSGPTFPVRMLRQYDRVIESSHVALQPSGIPRANLGHLFYDSFLLEAAIAQRDNITHILGRSFSSRTNLVYELRRRLFVNATYLGPDASGCFRRLWAYSHSCDRGREPNSSEIPHTVPQLRRVLVKIVAHRFQSTRPLFVFYGRSDASHRRLRALPEHYRSLSTRLSSTLDPLLWDDWLRFEPPVRLQAAVVMRAQLIITPHGAWPLVWAAFMRPHAYLIELFSVCVSSSWLRFPAIR